MEHKNKTISNTVCAVITISDTRTKETDLSGALIKTLLLDFHHEIRDYLIVKDEPLIIQDILKNRLSANSKVVITNGGTGISTRDTTFEVIKNLLEKEITGFGELFRYLSYKDIGSRAMLSRAIAGIYNNRLIFSLPGSPDAVKLGMEKLILPELGHILWELVRNTRYEV